MTVLVVSLSSAGRGDVSRVGGKAANLGEMLRAGLPVPAGFAVTCDAYREHVASSGIAARIHDRLAGIDVSDPEDVAGASADIRAWFDASAPPAALSRAMAQAFAALAKGALVAVRSSAVAEDLPGASFAGQHDSFLNVAGLEAALDAIRRCWASLWAERAILYRAHNGFAVEDAEIACIVQEMVPAAAAGVAFTADPLTGERDRIVVNAVAGLGESLVSGRATPDQYVVRKADAAILEERLAGALPGPPAFLPALAELCGAAERLFGAPQDLEWAFAGGRVSLLQSRPITRLPAEPISFARAERPILCYSERVREMVPSALTPLTADIALNVIIPAISESAVRQGLAPRSLVRHAAKANRLVRGRPYLNMTVFREVAAPGLDELALLDLLEHGRRPRLRALRPSLALTLAIRLPLLLARLVPMLLRLKTLGEQACAAIDRITLPFEKEDLRTWDAGRLRSLLRLRVSDSFYTGLLDVPQANALARGLGTPFYTALGWMASHWAGEPPESRGVLVSGLTGLIEVDCAAALWDLADGARKLPAVARALEAAPEHALERLSKEAEATAWLARFDAFLGRFGHRAIEEVELARPRWRERPAYPLSVIANYLRCAEEAAPRAVEARRRAEREAIEARVVQRLRMRPLRRALFHLCLRIAQQASAAGENTKFHIVRILTLMREAALELGRRLAASGRLDAAEDVFFLELRDLEDHGDKDLRSLVASRHADQARWQKEEAPRLIDAQGRPVREGLHARGAGDPALLHGVGSSPGLARGRVRVVRDPSGGVRLQPGEILVAPYTDPAWTPLFLSAGAAVVETGSLLSHASIVARELGIPSVVALHRATEQLAEAETVEVDGTRGTVRRLRL